MWYFVVNTLENCFLRRERVKFVEIEHQHGQDGAELDEHFEEIEKFLGNKNATQISNDLCNKSMQLLRSVLFLKYGNKSTREIFGMDDLWQRPQEFIAEYPVVLSTTFSSRSSVCKNAKYDYVIIDEASQVDVATGALALSCAKNVVIVGDSKQLPNVVTEDVAKRTDVIFEDYITCFLVVLYKK